MLGKLCRRLSSSNSSSSDVISSEDENFDAVSVISTESRSSLHDTAPEEVKQLPFYHGYLPRQDATDMVIHVGDFLLRRTDMKTRQSVFMLTVRIEQKGEHSVDHVLVPRDEATGKWQIGENNEYDTFKKFIDDYMKSKQPIVDDDNRYILKYGIPRQSWQFPHANIVRQSKVGQGAFGEVWKGYIKIDNSRFMTCAIKSLPTGTISTKEMREEFIREARVCRQLQFENIVKFRGIAIDEEPIMMMLEWCELGSLLSYMKKKEVQDAVAEHVRWCVEAAQGMRYLEKHAVIHRDVAARNCLLNANCTVKMADFGLSLSSHYYRETTNQRMPIRWLAPESLKDHIFTGKTDVWSFGILMFEIFANGEEPYKSVPIGEIPQKIVTHQLSVETPSLMPNTCETIMRSCLNYDADARPTFLELKKKLRKELARFPGYKMVNIKRALSLTSIGKTLKRTVGAKT